VRLPAAAIFFPMPRDRIGHRLAHHRLSINILYAFMGERQSNVLDREKSRAMDRQALHSVFKIDIGTSNGDGKMLWCTFVTKSP
jgi:hypothetical protein